MNEPLTTANFVVEIDGLGVADFSEVTGLGVEVDVIEYRQGTDPAGTPRKIPGLVKYGNVTLKRGIARDNALWSWISQVIRGPVERRTVIIRLLDRKREVVWTARLAGAWPFRYVGPTLNGTGSDVAIEEIVLCHEGLDIETAG